jgi:hypothetical protein
MKDAAKKNSTIKQIEKEIKKEEEFITTSRHFNEDDIKNAPTLILEELSGNILRGQKLHINAAGLINGLRKAKDGIAFFGKQLKKGDQIVNDFELSLDYPVSIIYVFIIYYKKDTNKFGLRTFKDKQIPGSSLLLIKLDDDYPITKKEIISISDNYFQLTPYNERLDIQKLAIKTNQVQE